MKSSSAQSNATVHGYWRVKMAQAGNEMALLPYWVQLRSKLALWQLEHRTR